MSLIVVITLIFTLIVTAWLYVKHSYSYWKRKGIPTIKSSFPFGTLPQTFLQKQPISEELKSIYESSTAPFIGIYTLLRPALLIRDPSLIRDVLIKDFSSFSDRGFHVNDDVDPLGDNILNQSGDKWKNARTRFSPTFTLGKLKAMMDTIIECGDSLQEYISKRADTGETIEVRDIFARFAINVIASFTFGIQVDCIKDPDSEFRKYGKQCFEPTIKSSFRSTTSFLAPTLSRLCRNRLVDKEIGEFMFDTVKQNLDYREKNNVTRKDFFQLLMQLRNTGKVQDDNDDWVTKATNSEKMLSINEMTAQSFLFFIAGFETNSSTMSMCLYEMARNPDVQQKAFEEISTVLQKYDDKLTYESLAEMKYMERCIEGEICANFNELLS